MNWRNDLTEEVIVPSEEVVSGRMAEVLEDPNPLHRDIEVAKRYTFSRIPVMGVFPMIHAEQQMFLAVQGLNGDKLRGIEFALKSPCYAGETLCFKFEEGNSGKVYKDNRVRGSDLIAEISGINLGIGFEQFDEARVKNVLHEFRYKFDREKLDAIAECLGTSKMERPSAMVVGSALPSALIKAGNQRGTPIDGIYHRASFKIFGVPEVGEVDVKLAVAAHRALPGGIAHAYRFKGFCYQNGKPIMEAELGVISRTDLKVEPAKE